MTETTPQCSPNLGHPLFSSSHLLIQWLPGVQQKTQPSPNQTQNIVTKNKALLRQVSHEPLQLYPNSCQHMRASNCVMFKTQAEANTPARSK